MTRGRKATGLGDQSAGLPVQPEPLSGLPQQEVVTTVKQLLGHAAGAVLEGALIAILITGLVVGTAFAAKGGGSTTGGGHKGGGGSSGGSGTISLQLPPVVDKNGDGMADWGDFVTFDISTSATSQPWVELDCFQNGVRVSQGWDGYFSGSLTTRNFGLYSPQWTGGAASCTAYLETPSWAVLGKTSFSVGA